MEGSSGAPHLLVGSEAAFPAVVLFPPPAPITKLRVRRGPPLPDPTGTEQAGTRLLSVMTAFSSQSTFLSLMTSTASEAASYEFTTLTCIPGVIEVSWGLLDPRRGTGVCLCLRLCVCVSCTSVCVSEGWVGILAAKTPEMPGPSCSPGWFQESGQ